MITRGQDVRTPLAAPTPYGQQLLALVNELEGSQWWSPEKLREYQLDQLRQLLAHAYETVPFYRARLGDVGYRPGQAITPEFWRRLPVLKRSEVQDQGDAIKSVTMPPEQGAVSKITTSGSTAMPLTVWRSARQALMLDAIVMRKLIWAGCDFRLKFGGVVTDSSGGAPAPAGGHVPHWGHPAALVYETGPGVTLDYLSTPDEIADWLVRERPDYLNIVPTLLHDICFCFQARGLTPSLKGIFAHAEIVGPDLRELARRAFGLELFTSYGARETGTIAVQCPEHQHYHVQAEATLVEVLDNDSNPCRPDEAGTVVVTPLHGYASPLLRYEIGDRAVVGRPCSCGRPHPVLAQVVGRTRDRIVLPSGMRRYCYFRNLAFWQFRDLRQFQIVQRTLYDLEVRLVARRRLAPEVEAEIAKRIKAGTSEHFSVSFTYLDSIPLPPSGKFQDLVCEVDPVGSHAVGHEQARAR
jgi:phenylacetate-CoA ligase